MFQKVLTKVFGSKEDRDVKRFRHIVEAVNQREPEIKKLTDAQLQSKTPQLRQQLEAGASLDELLPDAFAVVREAAARTLKQRHYDVQLMGGAVLHQGRIAEMRTGEGKNADFNARCLFECPPRKGRASGDCQRLSCPP